MNRIIRTHTLAFLLALAALASLVLPTFAATMPGDINGDSKVTVFDAQLLMEAQAGLRALTADQQEAAGQTNLVDVIKTILGTMPGAIDSDGDGIMEVYTVQGLEYMAENTTGSYQLMNDIDMAGINWTPIEAFNGSFDGNDYTIKNFVITEDGVDCRNSKVMNMGFFGDTETDAVITDLNLRNVTVIAGADSDYMGLLIGSNRGKIENCTVTGTIIDSRETHASQVYIGAMAGRICSVSSGATTGSLIGGTNISITDTAGAKTTTGLCADAKFVIADEAGATVGMIGYKPNNATVSGIWADTSNSYTLMSETIQARREEVVRYMNEMGSFVWTPSETLTYTDARGSTATYKVGTLYYGMPYNHKNGSLERFLSVIDENGKTITGLGNSVIDSSGQVEGFVQIMGNDCADAIAQAWQRVSPLIVADAAGHHPPYHGGAFATSTIAMVPKESVRNTYGIYQVGNWSSFSAVDATTGMNMATTLDLTEAAYECPDVITTQEVLAANSSEVMYEAYAKASKGDAIVAYAKPWGDGWAEAGHSRLLTADPIVIRDCNGDIDTTASYMVTTEQGGGGSSGTGWRSTWRVDYVYDFKTLLDDSAESGTTGYYRTYVPITIRALHDENIRTSYINNYTGENAVTAPNKGKIYSNYRIISTTVTVKNGSTVVYEGEKFTGVGATNAISGDKNQTADLADHSADFQTAAQEAGLVEGNTYTFIVEVLLSDGSVFTSVNNKTFTYQP